MTNREWIKDITDDRLAYLFCQVANVLNGKDFLADVKYEDYNNVHLWLNQEKIEEQK